MREGISFVCKEISRSFLSLRGDYKYSKVNIKNSLDYVKILSAFDYLCNLNIRDREYASENIRNIKSTFLNVDYPDIISGIEFWARGDLNKARIKFVEHLTHYPSDFVVIFMLHMFDFLHGNVDLYCEYLYPDERCNDPFFGSYYKGILGFSLCERSNPEIGYSYAWEACDRDNFDDIYSLHALIHCWHAMGDHERVVNFLEERNSDWYDNEGMNIHVNWHLAISLLYLGRIECSVESYRLFRSLSSGDHAEQDLDAVNFCLRLFFNSHSHPEFISEYQRLAHNWAPSIYNSLSYFNDVHAAIAFMLAGDKALMKKLLNRPEILILDTRTRRVGETVLHAISDFLNEHYLECQQKLESTRAEWPLIGGSYAQREILDILLQEAQNMQDVCVA